jgi:Icc-related predicted phosphoesterase
VGLLGRRKGREPAGRRQASRPDVRVFFASDIHGSERCFRKFLNAVQFYEVDALVLGGDLTGKALVPIVDTEQGSYEATFMGSKRRTLREDELDAFRRSVRDAGYYPLVVTRDELARLSESELARTRAFEDAMTESLQAWRALADERLSARGVRCYFIAGNDDPMLVDDALAGSEWLVNVSRGRAAMVGDYEIVGMDYANQTPWDSEREVTEPELRELVDAAFVDVADPHRVIFNAHCPPRDTPLDKAPALTDDLRPVMAGGEMVLASVGSAAIRDAIEAYQPAVALHGHVHESRAAVELGRTLCVNPGSEYAEGVLRGAVVGLSDGGVVDYQFVAG